MRTITLLVFLLSNLISFAQPDTTTNRYADVNDATFWNNVNEGDYIFFTGNINNGESIYAGGTVFTLSLPLGKKILIWRGSYRRILIDGVNCQNTASQPTIVTNLGGQVKWGYSEEANHYRTLELNNFEHLYLSGKYDPIQQTGNSDFLGHNDGNDYGSGNFHEKYGFWGNPKWSGIRYNGSYSNIVTLRGFKTLKVDYVAASEGGFAGFNLKRDNPSDPDEVEIDVQDCFTALTESEGFYISYSTSAANQDITKLTMKNNIMAFNGSEALQTDNLVEGTVIENNVAFAGSCFHRTPFQDLYQDGLHQLSFCEGGVTVQNNVMINGNSLHQLRYKDPGAGRVTPDVTKKVLMKNNYYGYSRSNIAYVWEGDGITQYEIDSNVYGPISTPTTRDAYNNYVEWPYYFKICNSSTVIDIKNTIYPGDRPLYEGICGQAQVDTSLNTAGAAPIIDFKNSGFDDNFDYRNISFWSAEYGTSDKSGQFIPYDLNDVVFYYDSTGITHFYECIQAHSGNFDPNNSPNHWELLDWSGNRLPPLDLRMECNSYYDNRDIGLTYKDSCTNNLKEFTNDLLSFEVYPNPSSGSITLSFEKEISGQVFVQNALGKIILTDDLKSTQTKKIDLSNYPTGIYFVQIKTEDNEVTRKLIKQ